MTLPFSQLVGLMVLGDDVPIAGTIASSEGVTRRVYRRGRLVREENADGTVRQVAGRERGWTALSQSDVMISHELDDHGQAAIGGLDVGGPRPSWRRWEGTDFTRPTGPVSAIEFLGRAAWAVELAPPSHKPHPLQLVIDAETGIVLRQANAGFGSWEEWTELEFGADLPDSLFAWEGPARDRAELMAQHEAEHAAEVAARSAWLESHGLLPLVVAAAAEVMLHIWDDAGGFQASLELGHATLSRRPHSDEPWNADIHYPHAYRWSDARWDWWLGSTAALPDAARAELKQRLASTT